MREILFRGKRVYDGEWVYGYYVYDKNYDKVYIDGFNYYDSEYIEFMSEVIPETVGQYTGVKDECGKKIFEGDIVKWFHGEIYTVVYEDSHFIGVKEYGFISLYDTTFEVIGNIHDEPEDGE